MKNENILLRWVIGFVFITVLCMVLASFISPIQAQITWNSEVTSYPLGKVVKEKEITVCNNGVFTKKIVKDTVDYVVDMNIVLIDTSKIMSKTTALKPTVIKDTVKVYKAYEPPPALWNKCTEKQKRDWCHNVAVTLLEGNNLKQQVHDYLFRYAEYAIYEHNHYLNEPEPIYILASGTLAQAFVEAGVEGKKWSSLCTTHNNHFGIKSHGKKLWKGKTTKAKDDHYVKGKLVHSSFRAYVNDAASYHDHSLFLLKGKSRYRHVLKAKTAYDYCIAIGKSGYATSKTYGVDVLSKVRKYKLEQFDVNFNTSYWKYNSDHPNKDLSSW